MTISTAVGLCALVGAFALAPAIASAQSAGADQYVPGPPGGGEEPAGGGGGNPDGGQGPTGGGGGNNPGGGGGDESPIAGDDGPADLLTPAAGTGQTDAGELPFTGYPLTTVLLVVFALLILGTLIRLAVAGRERIRTQTGAGT